MSEHDENAENVENAEIVEKRPIPPERTKFNQLDKPVARSQTMMSGRPSTIQRNKVIFKKST